jgi:hypothetical protein
MANMSITDVLKGLSSLRRQMLLVERRVISMSAYGPLVVVEGKYTAETYIKTLKDYLLPEIRLATSPVKCKGIHFFI